MADSWEDWDDEEGPAFAGLNLKEKEEEALKKKFEDEDVEDEPKWKPAAPQKARRGSSMPSQCPLLFFSSFDLSPGACVGMAGRPRTEREGERGSRAARATIAWSQAARSWRA